MDVPRGTGKVTWEKRLSSLCFEVSCLLLLPLIAHHKNSVWCVLLDEQELNEEGRLAGATCIFPTCFLWQAVTGDQSRAQKYPRRLKLLRKSALLRMR